jgi:cephalosporin hydroxylase
MKPYDGGLDYGVWLAPGNQEVLDRLIAKHNIRTVLEIGTCYGASAIWFARHKEIERVTCIDLWCAIPEHGIPEDIGSIFWRNCIAANVAAKMYPVRGNSHDKDTFAVAQRADLVYLDAGHTYEDVRLDIMMYGPLANKVLCGDDYDVDLPSVSGVIRAVDEFVPSRQTHGRFWWSENA